ncbi:MAG: glycosyltransferase family 4 protein, partial [Chloroflexota bacterium]
MTMPNVHQIMEAAMPGDAVFNMATAIRTWLKGHGNDSHILANHIAPSLKSHALPYNRGRLRPGDILLYHYALSTEVSSYVTAQKALGVKTVLLYHNMTPARYFRYEDPLLYKQLQNGQQELSTLRDSVDLAVAMSDFSKVELSALGYRNIAVLPAVIIDEKYEVPPDPDVLKRWGDGRTILLFVGRIAPNKKQEDLIKAFYFYKRINPHSSLLLVGALGTTQVYYRWVQELAEYLKLSDVHFCGHVTQSELNAYYKVADVFVSMSEHEGFGVPLVESMHFGIPVIAYKATAVPETLGEAGIMVKRKDFPVIAELIDMLVSDKEL